MPESRERRQDRALVLLLQALPEDRLDTILAEVGVSPERVAEAKARRDDRYCQECGLRYPKCRAINEAAPVGERHEWKPPSRPEALETA